MQGRIIIHLVDGSLIAGVAHEFDLAEVQETVNSLLQAEGQGSFVLDMGDDSYAIMPTRSILYTTIEPIPPLAAAKEN